jgi:hypothetical protein
VPHRTGFVFVLICLRKVNRIVTGPRKEEGPANRSVRPEGRKRDAGPPGSELPEFQNWYSALRGVNWQTGCGQPRIKTTQIHKEWCSDRANIKSMSFFMELGRRKKGSLFMGQD